MSKDQVGEIIRGTIKQPILLCCSTNEELVDYYREQLAKSRNGNRRQRAIKELNFNNVLVKEIERFN